MLNLSHFFKKEPSKFTLLYVSNLDAYSSLPRGTRKILEMLWEYEFPSGLTTRLKEKYPFSVMSDKEIVHCLDEFKKFMAVMVIGKKKKQGVAMTSNVIDIIWHQFILFTIEYEKFSQLLNGKFIHHTPNTEKFSFGPDTVTFFYSTYREYFGELHPIWLHTITKDETSEVDCSKDGSLSLLQVLSGKGESDVMESFALTKKYQLSKKANLSKSPVGIGKDATSGSRLGGLAGIGCVGDTTGYTAADGSGISDLGGCGGVGGCGGCGGCGG